VNEDDGVRGSGGECRENGRGSSLGVNDFVYKSTNL